MPRGMGYKQRMDRKVKQPGGGYHGTGSVDNSYRYSKAKPPAGDAMRSSGFSRNPKQNSSGRMTSNAFPDNPGQGLKGNAGLPKGPVRHGTDVMHGSHGPKGGMRSKSHKGY